MKNDLIESRRTAAVKMMSETVGRLDDESGHN